MASLFVFAILIPSILSRDPTKVPTTDNYHPQWKNKDSKFLLKSIFSFMSDKDLDTLYPMTSTMLPSEVHNASKWQAAQNDTSNHVLWGTIHNEAEERCLALNLSSSTCYTDCLAYNSPPALLGMASSSYYGDVDRSIDIVKWYTVSGSPISWNVGGNVDMCEYFEGTYCYTPSTLAFDEVGASTEFAHGCCVPSTCTGSDAVKVAQSNDWCYKKYQQFSAVFSEPLDPICEPLERDMAATGGWSTIIIFFLFLSCIIVASVFKRYWMEFAKIEKEKIDAVSWIKVFNAQSIWTAFGKLRAKEHSQFNFLDGVRVLSMTWVILGHSWVYVDSKTSNASSVTVYHHPCKEHEVELTFVPIDLTQYPSLQELSLFVPDSYHYKAQDLYTILIQMGAYSVDSFFFMSGFLGTLSLWRSIQKIGDRPFVYIPMSYLTRFLRMAPMMMYGVLIWMTLLDQIPYGYHVQSRSEHYNECRDYWYRVLFFYDNLTMNAENRMDHKCVATYWYLQCDMQMYLFLPIVLWLFSKKKLYGIVASIIPVVICMVIRVYYALHYDFVANVFVSPYPSKHGSDQPADSYFKPWTRMSTYFIAVLLAMAMIIIDEKKETQKFVLKKWQYWCCMIMAAFIMLSLVFWPYQDVKNAPEDRWNETKNQFYYSLGGQGGPAWAVALSLMTFAFKYMDEDTESDGNGQKSMVKAFLSLEIWQPLCKLTYTMYLVHVMVMMWYDADLETATYYTVWYEWEIMVTVWFSSAIIALVLWFVIEKPLNNMVTLCMSRIMSLSSRKKKQRRSKTRYRPKDELLLGDGVEMDDSTATLSTESVLPGNYIKSETTKDRRALSPHFGSQYTVTSRSVNTRTIRVDDDVDPEPELEAASSMRRMSVSNRSW